MISLSEDLYASYPRHMGRGAAIKAIEKSLKKVPYGRLSAALQAYCRKVEAEGTEDQFIPYPATWFNQGRYDDDMTPYPRTNGGTHLPSEPGLYVETRTPEQMEADRKECLRLDAEMKEIDLKRYQEWLTKSELFKKNHPWTGPTE